MPHGRSCSQVVHGHREEIKGDQPHAMTGAWETIKGPPILEHQGISNQFSQGNSSFSSPFLKPQGFSGEIGFSASHSTQARDESLEPTVDGNAFHDQGEFDRSDQELRRDSSEFLEQAAADSAVGRAQVREGHEPRRDSQDDDGGPEQGLQEEERPAVSSAACPEEEDHRQRNHSQAARPGTTGNPGGTASDSTGRDGLRRSCRGDIRGCPQEVSTVCPMVPQDSLRGGCQLAHEALPPVDQPTGGGYHLHVRDHGQAAAGTLRAEQDSPASTSRGFGPLFRLQILREHRGLLLPDEQSRTEGHMVLRGRAQDGEASGSTGGADPRDPPSASTGTQGSQDEDRLGGAGDQDPQDRRFFPVSMTERPLGDKTRQFIVNQAIKEFEEDWSMLINHDKCRLLEVCCSPESEMTRVCHDRFGPNSAFRVAHWNGGDIETTKGREYIKQLIREKKPQVTWIAPECGPFSPMQRLNQKTEQQRKNLEDKRNHAHKQYEGALEIARFVHSHGGFFVVELSERCEAWNLKVFHEFQKQLQTYMGVCKGCQVGLRDTEGMLLGKGWKMLGNNEELIRHLSLRCSNDHPHGKCEGQKVCRQTAFYTPEFAKRVINHLSVGNRWDQVANELTDGRDARGVNLVARETTHVIHDEKDQEGNPKEEGINNPMNGSIRRIPDFGEENMSHAMPATKSVGHGEITDKEYEEIMSKLRKIHSATGHCSRQYLVNALLKRNADPKVIQVARTFKCSVCQENVHPKPRPQANLEEIPPKWSKLQADVGMWYHPETKKSWFFILAVDEGSRLRVGKLVGEGKHQSVSGQDFIDFFEDHWRPLFGNPDVIRLDPAGAFRSNMLDDYFSSRGIMVDHIAAEAHWQISLVERSIQTTKNMLGSMFEEFPSMRVHESFARVLWAQNTRDQYLGFSPLQHVLGRNPNDDGKLFESEQGPLPVLTENGISAEFGRDGESMKKAEEAFIEQQYKQKLQRASHSGSRKVDLFKPGDLVFYWRKQLTGKDKDQGTQTFRSGAFLGPARVLATETKRDSSGNLSPGNIVWLFRGSRLIRAAPQQLRRASDREEAWCELQGNQVIPWTISSILEHSQRKTFEDITAETPGESEEIDWDMEEAPKLESSERTPAVRRSQPAIEIARPAKQLRSRANQEPPPEDHSLLAMVATEPSKHLEDTLGCLEVAIDLPPPKTAKKGFWMRDFDTFVLNQVKKNHVEVSERRLSKEELAQFDGAKQKEIKNYILAKVFARVPMEQRPDADQILKMRWVLTWKIDPETEARKAKARAVILGYQDPLYETRPTASPTMTRATRQLFLTMCAAKKFLVEKGDVSGAFLQGRDCKDNIYVQPLKEICAALDLPEGSVTRLTKAAYGLVQAPLEWYLTVDEFLRSLGFERQKSDPCAWSLFDHDDEPIAYICGHVDDFLFGGRESDPRWHQIKAKIKERFQWGQWESKQFTQCGVDIVQHPDYSFTLSQPSFLDQVSEIHLSKQRFKDKDLPSTQDEKKQMRSVLGCLSWHAGQLAMELSAPVSLLLSKINTSTVEDVVEVNKIVKRAKSRSKQAMLIHCLDPQDLLIAAWVDAAHANRTDLSSTKGILIGCTSSKLLDGHLEVVNPLFWCSSKITRVCRSSASAETRAAVDGEDQMYALRFQLSEFRGFAANPWQPDETVNRTAGVLISDSKNLFDRLSQTMLTLKGAEKRSDIESLCLKESMFFNETSIRWVNGDSQLSNSLTKQDEPQQIMLFQARNGRWRIIYDQSLMSGKKRKSLGLGALETQQAEDQLQEV